MAAPVDAYQSKLIAQGGNLGILHFKIEGPTVQQDDGRSMAFIAITKPDVCHIQKAT